VQKLELSWFSRLIPSKLASHILRMQHELITAGIFFLKTGQGYNLCALLPSGIISMQLHCCAQEVPTFCFLSKFS
jgi:hypothetical protein